MCLQVKAWFERQKPTGLRIEAAETCPGRLTRITYVHADGWREQGVAAVARAAEHINLGWAYLGWGARLPLINQALQLLVDASGGEPREIACDTAVNSH